MEGNVGKRKTECLIGGFNGVVIPKRPRGFVGRSRFVKRNGGKPAVENGDGCNGNRKDAVVSPSCKLNEYLDGKLGSGDKRLCSRRNGSKSRKRKSSEPSGKTVTKKVEPSSKTGMLDDLEQNAARMLSSRFNPALPNAGGEKPVSVSDPVSDEAADRESRLKRRLAGEGTSKRRQYYEVHTFRMGAHWYLNRKIKIYWPLDKCWYYGRITEYDLRSNLHHVVHDDGDDEWVCLDEERFELLLRPRELPPKPIVEDIFMATSMETESVNKDATSSEGTHKRPTSVPVQDDSFLDAHMESEPLIKWLTPRVNSSTLKKQSHSSAFSDTLIEDSVPLASLLKRNRNRRFRDRTAGLLKLLTTALIKCKKFEVCAPLWPLFISVALGTDILWLLRRAFLLRYGTMVTMWPSVFLDVLFVDNIIGLRLFRFEGCLKKAVAFVLLIMKLFCEPEEDDSVHQQAPVTSIRLKLYFFQSFRRPEVFSCCRLSKVRDLNWKCLDSEFQPHCVLSRQLQLSECTYDNVKLLEAGTQQLIISHAAQTASYEVLHKKSDDGGVLVVDSSGSSTTQIVYSWKYGNIFPFGSSFTASPNIIFNQHLKRLLVDVSGHEAVSRVGCAGSQHGQGAAIAEVRKKSTTAYISSAASGISEVNYRLSRQLGVIKETTTSNFKGVSVDGIICNKASVYADLEADGKTGFFGNRPKKPRTQVQYTLPKNKGNNQIGPPYHRLRRSKDKMTSSESAFAGCEANILVYGENIGWRECGARVSLESDQHNEWKLVVKRSGELRYTYKVIQDLQPGFTNRYTHVMMWRGEKDWGLEFPDRSQWSTFKEMHEECHKRNLRAAALKRIPIPGVRVINDSVDIDMPCFNRGIWYMLQVGDDVEMALDASHVMYDMDSDDEQWVCKEDMISDEVFEKVMDMFEKFSYAQKRDHFTPEEIDELIARVCPVQVAKSVYDYWWEKRQRKGIPLIRQLQPPLWEIYQKQCREWEKQKLKLTTSPLSGSREKVSTAEDKPPMFAFCLKPRGLELLNKGSRHRPQKKISLSSQKDVFVDNSGGHRSSGKKKKGQKSVALNKLAVGGLDLDDLRARDALTTLKHARHKAKLMRERARKLMMSADVAVHKATAILMAAEAMKDSCTATGNDDPSTTS